MQRPPNSTVPTRFQTNRLNSPRAARPDSKKDQPSRQHSRRHCNSSSRSQINQTRHYGSLPANRWYGTRQQSSAQNRDSTISGLVLLYARLRYRRLSRAPLSTAGKSTILRPRYRGSRGLALLGLGGNHRELEREDRIGGLRLRLRQRGEEDAPLPRRSGRGETGGGWLPGRPSSNRVCGLAGSHAWP